jgi:ribosome biogenesis GTPase / thiamine phosphate phosphatase
MGCLWIKSVQRLAQFEQAAQDGAMINPALTNLGWTPDLQAAWQAADLQGAAPFRIAMLHKSRAEVLGPDGPTTLTFPPDMTSAAVAVGDWVLAEAGRIAHILTRHSVLQRRAAGTGIGLQLIAANVDTMLITTACGPEFNPARLERYLVLAHASDIAPVLVLTKADMLDPAPFVAQAIAISGGAPVLALNAKTGAAALLPYIGAGKTAVLMGSSGVGKSTLANGLLGSGTLATGEVREKDARGRHTTTARHLFALPSGGWLIDTPGVREVQLADVADGIDTLFADILELGADCHYRNCTHQTEPKCAVLAAVARGELDGARLDRWRKLTGEQAGNSAALTLSQTRAAGRHTKKSAAKHAPRS